MATLFTYYFSVRDHSVSPIVRKTGLTPTWLFLNASSNNASLDPAVAVISEVGGGIYKVAFDVETYGEAVGQIDCGSSLSNVDDRYADMILTAFIKLDLGQNVPNISVNARQTVGSGLLGADADAFGKQVVNETTFTKFASDGATVLREFNLDSASAPKERT